MRYKSPKHEKYAKYLESQNVSFIYREVFVPYYDSLTGKKKKYYIDFVLLKEAPEWVEVTSVLKPVDKRVYASRQAESAGIIYRCLNQDEINYIKET